MITKESGPRVLERVAQFGEGNLAGVTAHSPGTIERLPVIILGAGIIHKVGPSRISVEVARLLAAAGHRVLRFDLSGIGDSPRSSGDSLEGAVKGDIRDAIGFLLAQSEGWREVALVGFCSGADNAFHMASEDPRIRAVAMFDPTVHATDGFRRWKALGRLRSPRSWMNVITGRSLWLRLRKRLWSEVSRPPGYYGLLVSGPAETDERAREAVARGVRFLYVLGGGAHGYCNSPHQVRESLPRGFSEAHFSVEWRPEFDHIFSDPSQRRAFGQIVREWLASLD